MKSITQVLNISHLLRVLRKVIGCEVEASSILGAELEVDCRRLNSNALPMLESLTKKVLL